jgi:hypothetical protein
MPKGADLGKQVARIEPPPQRQRAKQTVRGGGEGQPTHADDLDEIQRLRGEGILDSDSEDD